MGEFFHISVCIFSVAFPPLVFIYLTAYLFFRILILPAIPRSSYSVFGSGTKFLPVCDVKTSFSSDRIPLS